MLSPISCIGCLQGHVPQQDGGVGGDWGKDQYWKWSPYPENIQ